MSAAAQTLNPPSRTLLLMEGRAIHEFGAFLGGHASPDTREILLSGENPLAAKLAATATPDSTMSSMATSGTESMTPMDAPLRGGVRPPAKNGQLRPAFGRAMGQQVQLNGLAQVIGLAIGAPEFQRR